MNASAMALAATVILLLVALRAAPAVMAPARSVERPIGDPGRRWTRRPWPPRWTSRRRRQAVPPDDTAVAEWCRRVAAGVRGGSSLSSAVIDAGEDGSPFPEAGHAIRRGRPLSDVLRSTTGDPRSAVGLAAPVLATCAELGGPAAGAIEQLGAVLDARAAARAERDAASAQARLSARVLTVVPLGVVGLLLVVEPAVRRTLATPAGSICLVAGAGLDLTGWWWMRRMIRGSQ